MFLKIIIIKLNLKKKITQTCPKNPFELKIQRIKYAYIEHNFNRNVTATQHGTSKIRKRNIT
jgi:hypothetical protein